MQNTVNSASACRACKGSGDKNTDTVKVDLENLAGGKENRGPPQQMTKETAFQKQQRAEQEEAERQRKQAEEEERRLEEERARQEEARRRAEEKRRQEEEAERQRQLEALRRKQAEEEEAQRLAEEEARRIEMEKRRRQEELERRQAEEMERQRQLEEEVERKRREQEALARKQQIEQMKRQLIGFLENQGFQAPDEKKVKKGLVSSSFSYPLHAAVEAKDDKAVELLLWAGADPAVQNSKKQTPLALAQAKNKQGSHAKVIAALAA